jgi:hypothetical protein
MDERKDTADSGAVQQSTSAVSQSVDLEKLAERVYQLMRAEVRQAQARGIRRSTRR